MISSYKFLIFLTLNPKNNLNGICTVLQVILFREIFLLYIIYLVVFTVSFFFVLILGYLSIKINLYTF